MRHMKETWTFNTPGRKGEKELTCMMIIWSSSIISQVRSVFDDKVGNLTEVD